MTKDEIIGLISEGELAKAIDQAKIFLKDNSDYYGEIIKCAAQFNSLEDEKHSGNIDREDYNVERNRITENLIYILDNHNRPILLEPSSNTSNKDFENTVDGVTPGFLKSLGAPQVIFGFIFSCCSYSFLAQGYGGRNQP